MRWWLAAALLVALALALRRFFAMRAVAAATPALRLAGGPPDAARDEDDGDDAAAGRPLLDAIAAVLRARGADVDEVEPEDWGYAADAVVGGQPIRLKLGAHGANGVGPEWLLVLDGADDSAGLRRAIEEAVAAVAGVRVLGWDD
jgi:hypothetical protein